MARSPENTALDPLPLLRGLYQLAQIPGFFVLTTVRQDTFDNNEKNFFTVAYIEPFVDPQRLLEIYNLRVQHFMAGVSPFTEDFVKQAAQSNEGRPGVFLRFLSRAFTRHGGRVSALSFDAYVSSLCNELERRLSPQFMQSIHESVTRQGGILSEEVSRRWRGTSAMQVLYEDYSSSEELRVDPILASYLRRQASTDRLP